ncbi:MAG: phage tail tape measure protein [Bacteroidales bacterium]
MAGRTDRNIRLSVYLDDKTGGLTLKQLKAEAAKLRNEIALLPRGTEEYVNKAKRLKEVQGGIMQINKDMRVQQGLWGRLADGANKFQALAVGVIGATAGLVLGFKNMVQKSAELSDSIADVQKTTGMAKEEVVDMMKEFRSIDTRSSRQELLELARVAGKIGVKGKEDILQFVRATDQIKVALSEDLGGDVEESVRQIGKLTDVFRLTTDRGLNLEESLLKTGSAINALGAASTANEEYLVEFSKRMGGIAPLAKISIEDTLGLGAALDQLGQTAEVSSTAFMKLIPEMFKDTASFAEIAGMKTEDFANLLSTDANEAILKFVEGLKGNNEGMSELAKRLDGLGIDGARAVGVLGVLANNINVVREQQKLSNEEFEKGTSLTEEFNTKNENLAANLQKVGRAIYGAFINSELMQILEGVVGAISRWTTTPLSETLEDQRDKVNKLVVELTEANTSLKRRKDILDELKAINPDIVEGLEAEKLNYDQLAKNVDKYNEAMLNRIILEEKKERIQRITRRQDFRAGVLAEETDNLRLQLMERVDQFQEKDAEYGKKALAISRDTKLSLTERVKAMNDLADAFNKVKNWTDSGIDRIGLFDYEDAQIQLDRVNAKLQNLIKERDEYIKQWGITSEDETPPPAVVPVYKEGDEMIIDGILMIYTGGKWVKKEVNTDTPDSGGAPTTKDELKQIEDDYEEHFSNLLKQTQKFVDDKNNLELKQISDMEKWLKETEEKEQEADRERAENEDKKKEEDAEKAAKDAADAINREQEMWEKRLQIADQFTSAISNLVYSAKEFELSKIKEVEQRQEESDEDFLKRQEAVEEEKKAIQKKYADIEFAITTARIVIDTASAIMKAVAQLGPVGGAIAGTIIGAAGLAQIAVANEQRKTVQGLFTGGYTGDGDPTQEAGVFATGQPFHKQEYVIPSFVRDHPYVRSVEPVLESIRQRKLYGYAEGGFVGDMVKTGSEFIKNKAENIGNGSNSEMQLLIEIRDAVKDLKYLKAVIDQEGVIDLTDAQDKNSATKAGASF